ncbi:bifunctional diguanylate cyclase/phosphodiesterase [Acidocella sp.]|uniref:putative bifunctional diguanylate cyclase/phosphodiesterase n=1 Tax=Acidocella sp. TaxID=50710 RepID=UPI00185D3F2F|nr:EAL domain-containing protein [Acidocella sp.]NNM57838.1 EAL domain-containing protein [Acidocella sp.]
MAEGVRVPEDLTERLLLDQAADFSYMILGISILGLSSISLLFIGFLRMDEFWLRSVVMGGVCVCYLVIFRRAVLWLKRDHSSGPDAKAYFTVMVRLLVVLGIGWDIMLVMLMRHHNVGQLSLMYGIFVGCLATPVMVSPIACALAYWAPICVGIFFAALLADPFEPVAMLNLVAFMGLTGFCIFYVNSRLNERAVSAIRLEEKSEVIKLLLRDFEESASDWLWETNEALELQQVSQRLTQVAHRPVESFRGEFPRAMLGEIMNYDHRPGSPIDRLCRIIKEHSSFRDMVVPVLINGEERYWSLTGKPVLDKSGRFSGYHGVGSDITGQRRQQEQIAFLARHDSLTKLANRVLFSEMLHQACDNCEQTGFALLCLDLDHFKIVNDTLGHATGDGVLVSVAERLRGCIREFDIAARLGGDEFAIILVTEDPQEAAGIASRIIERVSRPYHFDGQMVQVGMSAGITMAPRDSRNPSGLMKNADLALYRAKAEGRGAWRLYDVEMDERQKDRRILQSALRQAVLRDEFRLEYQPLVDLADGRIIGAEALLRWQHPERGLLAPGEFIALAEEAGLIGQIGEWVLGQACREAAGWPEHVGIAVNLSPLQFRDSGLVEIIDRALAQGGLAPERLELEITETTMLETNSETVDALWQLHGRGVRIALDDFGTGYSSLSYLRRFPFDKIKIDRSFIRDLGYEKDDSSIILAIIGLAERMSMVVTAEGVETPKQAQILKAYGCGQAQGYLFSRPVPGVVFAQILEAGMLQHKWKPQVSQIGQVAAQ